VRPERRSLRRLRPLIRTSRQQHGVYGIVNIVLLRIKEWVWLPIWFAVIGDANENRVHPLDVWKGRTISRVQGISVSNGDWYESWAFVKDAFHELHYGVNANGVIYFPTLVDRGNQTQRRA
jgi:hypothetical protein